MKNKDSFFWRQDTEPKVTKFTPSDQNNFKDVFTGPNEDGAMHVLNISSTDNNTRVIDVYYAPTYTDGNLTTANIVNNGVPLRSNVTIVALEGTSSSFPNPLRLVQSNGQFIASRLLDRDQNFYVQVKAGWSVYVRIVGTHLNTGTFVTVYASGKEF